MVKLDVSLPMMVISSIVHAFKAAHYLSPSKISELKLTAADINSLASFPFLKSELIESLKIVI